MRRSIHGWSLMGLGAALAVPGCSPSAIDGGFDSANPAARAYAIEQAAQANDIAALPEIVEELDADDPMIRMIAITALQRMTGQTFGYQYEAASEARREAIERWVAAVEAGAFDSLSAGEAVDG